MRVGGQTAYETTPVKPFEDEQESEIIQKMNFCPKGVYILNLASSLCNTFILSTSGMIYSFGLKCETLGRNAVNQADASKPNFIQIQTKIVQICAGTNHVLALDTNGQIYSWGRNEFGQLGHNDTDNQSIPKQLDFFQKDPVLQIYAGGDSSYAVTKKGSLFVWGDNRNYQLGLIGQVHYEPKLVIHTPWENSKELRIIYGKNNMGYMFLLENSIFELQVEKENIQIQELQSDLQKLQQKLFDIQGVGQKQPLQLEKNLSEDGLLRQVQTQVQSAQGSLASQVSVIKSTTEEVSQLEKELASIRNQLFEIFNKENELNNQREIIDMEVRRFERSGGDPKEREAKIKDQKRIKELFQANDNIKNNLLKRQNQAEENKLRKQEELTKQQEKLNDLHNLINLLQTVEADRKIALRRKFLEQNKADLEKFMDKINHFFKQMLESNISDIAKKSTQLQGVKKLIEQSNEKLTDIKNELLGFKVNSNDESYEILSKILDILQDNLNIRKKLNDYMAGVIMTVNEKQQKSIRVDLGEKQQQRILNFIQQQQDNVQSIGKEYIDSKKYKIEIQHINDMKQKQREFCFGLF